MALDVRPADLTNSKCTTGIGDMPEVTRLELLRSVFLMICKPVEQSLRCGLTRCH